MSEFWNDDAAPGALTLEALERAIEAVKNAPPDPCSLGHHVISAEALRTPGWYTCGNCRRPLRIEHP